MNAKIESGTLQGRIVGIPSKSYAHRIVICSFLAGEKTKIVGLYPSKDILATMFAITTLGGSFQGDTLTTSKINHSGVVNAFESGSTLRFLLPLLGAVGGDFKIIGKQSLLARPNGELFSVLQKHGLKTSQSDKICVEGKLCGGKYEIRGDISSQYISGLLMALPILGEDSEIVLTTPLSSEKYVDITLEVMKMFSVKAERTSEGFFIKGNQKYISPKEIVVENDFSNIAFFLTYGAIMGGIEIEGMNMASSQGDKAIVDVLKNMGAKIEVRDDVIFTTKSDLSAITLDVDQIPDLLPILSVAAAMASGRSVFQNISRLKIKESDRVSAVIEMLQNVGINAYEENNSLIVEGGKIVGGKVNSKNDHRIAMSAAILGILSENGVVIEDALAVEKSYPSFFEDFGVLGGKVDVEI